MRRHLIVAMLALAGCASQIMESYVGKDITEAVMDHGPPAREMDLPDGSRAFIWSRSHNWTAPSTTRIGSSQRGDWASTTVIGLGGGTNTYQCHYTLIGKRNRQRSYTVVSFRPPPIACE